MGSNKNPRIIFNCYYCGEESSDKPSHFAKKKRHFCSMQCYADYRREIMTKEEHNRYGTGLSEEERKLRRWCRSTTNHAIRDGVLKREYCKICYQWAEAHHDCYTLPLHVTWLCFRHHRELHRNENPELLK